MYVGPTGGVDIEGSVRFLGTNLLVLGTSLAGGGCECSRSAMKRVLTMLRGVRSTWMAVCGSLKLHIFIFTLWENVMF